MADQKEVDVDERQVKKAVQALLAYLKSRSKKSNKDNLFMDDTQPISVLFTLWKIPKEAQTIRIPLPHGQSNDTEDVCLFTRDEPQMTSDQTQRFYKKLLEVQGVKNINEIIPLNVLKTEYKSHEAKRRLVGNFSMFLSDARVRRLLPSHIGRHFYERKREPLCVDLQSKTLARDIEKLVQGTKLKVSDRGACCMAQIGHSGMTAEELTENILASIQTAVSKIRMKGPVLKVVHLKSLKSVALPIYTASLKCMESLLKTPEDIQKEEAAAAKKAEKEKNKGNKKEAVSPVKEEGEKVEEQQQQQQEEEEKEGVDEEEEIPQLVPIATPSKKPKLEKPSKKEQEQLEKAPKSQMAKRGKNAPNKQTKKAGKTDSKAKRKVPKVK